MAGAEAAVTPAARLVRATFENLEGAFRPGEAAGWSAVLIFSPVDGEVFSVRVEDGAVRVEEGRAVDPTCVVSTDLATLAGMIDGTVDGNQAYRDGRVQATRLPELVRFGRAFVFDEAFLEGVRPASRAPVRLDAVGRRYRMPPRFARPEHIEAYARATGDLRDEYRAAAGREQVGSPLYPVALLGDLLMETLTDPALGLDASRVVHGQQRIRYRERLHAWDLLCPRARVLSIEEKSSGFLVELEELLMREGEPVVEMLSGLFVRTDGARREPRPDPGPEPPPPPAPLYTHRIQVAEDQARRYAEASGDRNPLHLDPEVARAAGLPAPILHGLCTMGMVVGALVERSLDGDAAGLGEVSVRFSRPVFPGDELELAVREDPDTEADEGPADAVASLPGAGDPGTRHLGFEVTNQRGEKVLTRGSAEIST